MASVDAKHHVYFTYCAKTSLDDGGRRSCRSRGNHFLRLAPFLSSSGASHGRPLQRGDETGAAFAARGHICCVLVGRRPAADCLSNVFVLRGLISLAVGNSSSRLGFLRCLPAKSKSLFRGNIPPISAITGYATEKEHSVSPRASVFPRSSLSLTMSVLVCSAKFAKSWGTN